MISIINNLSVALHIIVACLVLVVWFGNFFKKKTLLEKYGLYGDSPIFVSFCVAVGTGFLFLADNMYSLYDYNHTSFHAGAIITMGIIAFVIIAVIACMLSKWSKNIPET